MSNPFRKIVAWTLLPQVLLVGGLGTGLHGLFGCEHGSVCTAECCSAAVEPDSSCVDCVFCRRMAANQPTEASPDSAVENVVAEDVAGTASAAGCDGCAVCDLLAQYHSATPFVLDSLTVELVSGEAAIQQQNGVIAASVRLALSRGPPAV